MRTIMLAAALGLSTAAQPATAQDGDQTFTLRIQSLFSNEALAAQSLEQFYDDIQTMSAGRITVEAFWSSAVV